jgi:dolichyl-phosphate-mannose--protein O-mannosyl transferase
VAENLAAGQGYIGLSGNLQLLYPPLFPGLIALGTALFEHAELVARIIDIVFGAALVVPTFLITRLIGGSRVAAVGALLVAFHPYLMAMSTVILSETLYTFHLLAGAYCVVTSVGTYSLPRAAVSGVCLGLAYLVRPEGMIFAILAAIALVVFWRGQAWVRLRMAAALVLCSVTLAAPYICWLSSVTAELMLEGKSADNYAAKRQLIANVPVGEWYFGIEEALNPV